MNTLVDAFESAHPRMAGAMADLLIRGNVILEEHQLLEGTVGDAFEAFIFKVLDEHGIGKDQFAATLIAFERLRDTIEHLDQLPP
ncbi:hypothetical protein [Variovorax soli]|uniref:Uncharacterized protein n=1 Tax=Variovorax soli TaxID=376815 RepID=A0ABU1NN66_9BURK|nr:hypothetical protein [Variovorax soli]MDR6539490.1 hypothetical protein [Variovorax soli]